MSKNKFSFVFFVISLGLVHIISACRSGVSESKFDVTPSAGKDGKNGSDGQNGTGTATLFVHVEKLYHDKTNNDTITPGSDIFNLVALTRYGEEMSSTEGPFYVDEEGNAAIQLSLENSGTSQNIAYYKLKHTHQVLTDFTREYFVASDAAMSTSEDEGKRFEISKRRDCASKWLLRAASARNSIIRLEDIKEQQMKDFSQNVSQRAETPSGDNLLKQDDVECNATNVFDIMKKVAKNPFLSLNSNATCQLLTSSPLGSTHGTCNATGSDTDLTDTETTINTDATNGNTKVATSGMPSTLFGQTVTFSCELGGTTVSFDKTYIVDSVCKGYASCDSNVGTSGFKFCQRFAISRYHNTIDDADYSTSAVANFELTVESSEEDEAEVPELSCTFSDANATAKSDWTLTVLSGETEPQKGDSAIGLVPAGQTYGWVLSVPTGSTDFVHTMNSNGSITLSWNGRPTLAKAQHDLARAKFHIAKVHPTSSVRLKNTGLTASDVANQSYLPHQTENWGDMTVAETIQFLVDGNILAYAQHANEIYDSNKEHEFLGGEHSLWNQNLICPAGTFEIEGKLKVLIDDTELDQAYFASSLGAMSFAFKGIDQNQTKVLKFEADDNNLWLAPFTEAITVQNENLTR